MVAGNTNNAYDAFVHDRATGQTTRVSVSSDGRQGNGDSGPAVDISADGRYVAFESRASNLVVGDSNNIGDMFVHDRVTSQTTRVSVASDGTQANGSSGSYLAISGDGRFVAFRSAATNLVPGDTNRSRDIFVRDRATRQTTRVSVASNGLQAGGDSADPALSSDGRIVAFCSSASNLVPGDTNQVADVFLHDRVTGQIEAGSIPGASNLAVIDTGNPTPSLTATVVPNGTYYVRVRARDAGGQLSGASNEVELIIGSGGCSGIPVVGGLAASVSGATVTLVWAALPGCPATDYILEAGSQPGLADLARFATGSAATGLQVAAPAGTYYVRVRGRNAVGVGPPSNEVAVIVRY